MTLLEFFFMFFVKVIPSCQDDMVLIEGEHCPVVEQTCIHWLDDETLPFARCAEYKKPTICKSERVYMKYCIDKYEYPDATGLPMANVSWTDAVRICKENGKHLCAESEWLFACEGAEANPYPYGYKRDSTICNIDKTHLVENGVLLNLHQPVKDNPKCVSIFGVRNLTGNSDEWVVLDYPYWTSYGTKQNSGLMGGWEMPARNRCRPITKGHDEFYHGLQTGFRCCSETLVYKDII